MASTLTAIVTACTSADRIKYTLEGLVEQSTEDFDVVIVDYGCPEDAKKTIKEYCDEYVGFESFEIPRCLVPAARNAGVKHAKGDLLYFIDGGDYISPDSVEAVIKAADEHNADIIATRLYISGENEPYYDRWADIICAVPEVDRFDSSLLHTLDYDGRVYRKKFFDLYSLSFPEIPVFYNAAFLIRCVYGCDAKVSGVVTAIYDKRKGVFSDGFTDKSEPSDENLAICTDVYEKAFSDIQSLVEEETGTCDGDEYAVQEMLSVYFNVLTERFYRYFWYLSDESLEKIRDKYEEISHLLTEDRRNKMYNSYKDLRFPQMYVTRADAAALPLFSIIGDIDNPEDLDGFIESLYIQRFPFFELYLRQSIMESESFPERWRSAENITVLPDEKFFETARKKAKGIPIIVKDPEPLDPKILSELSLSKAPKSVIQYMFASKRKKYSTKTYLKHKGLAMQ